MKRIVVIALSVILALIVAAPLAAGQTSSGQSPLIDDWWNWAASKPTKNNPLVGSYEGGPQCDGTNTSGAWFLAGSTSSAPVVRTCTAPPNTELFFPVVNVVCSEAYTNPPDPTPYDKCASDIIDRALKGSETFAKITKLPDGSPQNLEFKRLENAPDPACANSTRGDCFFWTIATNDNPFGVKAGTYPAASDGLWVDLKDGLQEGDYKLEFGGKFPSVRFKQQITYNLTVK